MKGIALAVPAALPTEVLVVQKACEKASQHPVKSNWKQVCKYKKNV